MFSANFVMELIEGETLQSRIKKGRSQRMKPCRSNRCRLNCQSGLHEIRMAATLIFRF